MVLIGTVISEAEDCSDWSYGWHCNRMSNTNGLIRMELEHIETYTALEPQDINMRAGVDVQPHAFLPSH